MGQAKRDRSIQRALELAETRLTETTAELIRRDRENAAAVERLGGEHAEQD